jgi:hypothetical protein
MARHQGAGARPDADGSRHAARARFHGGRRRGRRRNADHLRRRTAGAPGRPGRAFYERDVERFGLEPECCAASAYDATGVILQAIERAGRLDHATITEAAFATCDFDGLLCTWSFDANGDIDLRRATRLTVRGHDFEPLSALEIE